jgi:hypothetical protein
MKRYISAPLCSALIIPGLGQVLNRELKKGVFLLGAVFLLINVAGVKLYLIVDNSVSGAAANGFSGESLISHIRSSDFTLLRVLGAVFAVIWVYAVVDAFLGGRKIEAANRKGKV